MSKETARANWEAKLIQKKELDHQKRTLQQQIDAQDEVDNDPRSEEEIDVESTALDAEITALTAEVAALENP